MNARQLIDSVCEVEIEVEAWGTINGSKWHRVFRNKQVLMSWVRTNNAIVTGTRDLNPKLHRYCTLGKDSVKVLG